MSQRPGIGPSLDPDEAVDNTLYGVVVTGRLIPSDVEFIRVEIERALKRLMWDDVTFAADVVDEL